MKLKHYHVSFDLDGDVHGIKVLAANEDTAREIATAKIRPIVEKQGCNLVIDETDICAVELINPQPLKI